MLSQNYSFFGNPYIKFIERMETSLFSRVKYDQIFSTCQSNLELGIVEWTIYRLRFKLTFILGTKHTSRTFSIKQK